MWWRADARPWIRSQGRAASPSLTCRDLVAAGLQSPACMQGASSSCLVRAADLKASDLKRKLRSVAIGLHVSKLTLLACRTTQIRGSLCCLQRGNPERSQTAMFGTCRDCTGRS